MKRKLNLTVDPALIELARRIGLQKNLSISQMFEQFVRDLMVEQEESFIDRFHRANKRYVDQLTDKDVEEIKAKRGQKWK